MFKNILLIVFIILFTGCSINQQKLAQIEVKNTQDNELQSHIRYILYLIQENNLSTLNKTYINQSFGFYLVNSLPNHEVLVEQKAYLDEVDNYIESFDISNSEISFNCSPYNDAFYGWSQNGVFVQSKTPNYLQNELLASNNEKKEYILKLINSSYEVIVTSNIVFHLTKIDKNYYITLIDNTKTDCSN